MAGLEPAIQSKDLNAESRLILTMVQGEELPGHDAWVKTGDYPCGSRAKWGRVCPPAQLIGCLLS
jgi:hypothetical protein